MSRPLVAGPWGLACLLQDEARLSDQAEAAFILSSQISGFHPTAQANLPHVLGLSVQPCVARVRLPERQVWLVARATDASMNFAHLQALAAETSLAHLVTPVLKS